MEKKQMGWLAWIGSGGTLLVAMGGAVVLLIRGNRYSAVKV